MKANTFGELDHYTLIVPDAEHTKNFYANVLGFNLISKILVNTGTVNDPEHDMLNYVLQLPGALEQTCVITQGLNEETIFSKYLTKNSPGVHHIAYRTSNIQKVFDDLKTQNIKLISDEIVEDDIYHLKQFFIDKSYSGIYIEIIERKNVDELYTRKNMSSLAKAIANKFE